MHTRRSFNRGQERKEFDSFVKKLERTSEYFVFAFAVGRKLIVEFSPKPQK